ncbi:molecular chaperone DnaJ [Aestuariimicrobium ganziense]|uniref:molecular chaperone DnaJ n=1 Tax=Aestuariimicrobium ganziense TaxID=2773677 RepID=UPI0019434C32|nr:molecular chaperone DnaJ [Aestuariimicrobium ganziense]
MSTKDWIEKDYYKVLGVSKDAKPEEIKKAFRKLARDNHPDQHPGDKAAENRFKEISEANTILSDPAKRKEYDEARRLFGGGGFRFPTGGAGGAGPNVNDLFRNASQAGGGFSDLFGDLFGQAAGRRPSAGGRGGPRRGSDVEGEVTINFTDAVEGVTVPVQMVSDAACSACRGTGAKAGTVPKVCTTCQGSGMQASTAGGVFQVTEPCRDCKGRGLVVDDPCQVCHGSGRGRSTHSMQVRVPAGVSDGQRIRIKGKGSAGENGGAAGDLYVVVHVRPHKLFGRKDDNLTLDVPVTFAEASLGATIEVPTLTGPRVKLKLPAGTPNGRTFRVRGKGVGRANGTHGDLLVTVDVQVPEDLTDDAKHALEEYVRLAGAPNPRQALYGN